MIHRAILVCIVAASFATFARGAPQIAVQFEGVAGGTLFPHASLPTSFVTEGVTVSLSSLSSSANASIGTNYSAGSTGNELQLWANTRAELDIGSGSTGGFFQYADLGGDNLLEINGSTIDFDIVSATTSTHGTVGGVSYLSGSLSGSAHGVKLNGPIHTFAVIGQELVVDRITLVLIPEPASSTLALWLPMALAMRRRFRGNC